MQDHLSNILNHIDQQKFYFRKFYFILQNFVPFCLILFYFSKERKFFFFEIYCSQLTIDRYCSQLTVDCYCYCYYSPKLQYNNCIAIQSSTASSCNTNSTTTHPSCNTIRVLQYNGSPTNLPIVKQFPFSCNTIFCHCTSYIAIQSPITIQFSFFCNTMPSNYTPRLQYNFFLLQYNPKPTTPFSCNTIAIQFFFQPSLLQYNCITIFPALSLAIQLQGCNTIFFFTIQFGQ